MSFTELGQSICAESKHNEATDNWFWVRYTYIVKIFIARYLTVVGTYEVIDVFP